MELRRRAEHNEGVNDRVQKLLQKKLKKKIDNGKRIKKRWREVINCFNPCGTS